MLVVIEAMLDVPKKGIALNHRKVREQYSLVQPNDDEEEQEWKGLELEFCWEINAFHWDFNSSKFDNTPTAKPAA